jgi:diguanylate cyclase (GGDEF)-like protein
MAGMSVEPILALIVTAVIANLVVMAVLVGSLGIRRGTGLAVHDDRLDIRSERAMAAAVVVGATDEDSASDDGVPTRAYDRVVRIVSWIFLLATTTIVGVTGLWPQNQAAILALLALAGLFVLVIHDLLPADTLGPAKFVVEGSVAVTVATLLVALTGGVQSPFFFVYPLIVGGAALVVTPLVTLGLAATAALGYLLAVVLGTEAAIVTTARTTATVGINLTAMILLAYVAMVIAREQRRSRDAAIRLSTIDPLTQLFNRGFFFAALEREIARSARTGRGFCLLMMDLDELKVINDRLGHFHGDRVLHAVGEVVNDGVRRIDTAARYGGDEFVCLLPETDPTGAFVLAEKIRIGVAELELDLPEVDVKPSLSVGVVSYPDDGTTADELMISADGAMYASKRAGKNRVTGVNMPSDMSGVTTAPKA